VEKLFGEALNIPVTDENTINKKKATGVIADMQREMESRKISSDRFKDPLLQWRLLFFFQDLHDKTLSELGDMATHEKVFLHVKLFDFVTTIEIHNNNKKLVSTPKPWGKKSKMTAASMLSCKGIVSGIAQHVLKRTNTQEDINPKQKEDLANYLKFNEECILRKMRVYYFFTEKDAELDEFIDHTEIEIRITDGPNWNNTIAKATCTPLIHFKVK
jgi:hypothetical protein